MNEELKQAQETLLELSSLALKYLVNNFHFLNEEYVERKSQIGNLTEKIKIALDNFYGYKDSQQDLIKGKDEYIAKLCNDRAELKEHEKELIAEQHRLFDLAKEQETELKQVEDFKYHYDRYKKELANNLKTINCMQEEATTNRNLIDSLEDRNDRLVERLEKQKAELNELREFARIMSRSVEVNEFGSTDAYYNTANVINKDTIVNEDVDLVKKVVEKYGK